MDSAVLGFVGMALTLLVGLFREAHHYRERKAKLKSETRLDDANVLLTTANADKTIGETYQGLYTVLERRLDEAEAKLEKCEQREEATRKEIESLRAKVTILMEADERKSQP